VKGEKPLTETKPEAVALARKLPRRKPKAGQMSLRAVAKKLTARGYLNERGKRYAAKSIASMLATPKTTSGGETERLTHRFLTCPALVGCLRATGRSGPSRFGGPDP
jgi:hypothetical protein